MTIFGLLLWFNLSLGLQQGYVVTNYDYYELPPITCQISIHAENDWLDVYGKYRNEMAKSSLIYFSPRQDTYTVGAKVTFDNVSFSLEHMCSHPVNPYQKNPLSFDQWYNRFEVSITSKKEK